jgi:hypothetical protein
VKDHLGSILGTYKIIVHINEKNSTFMAQKISDRDECPLLAEDDLVLLLPYLAMMR